MMWIHTLCRLLILIVAMVTVTQAQWGLPPVHYQPDLKLEYFARLNVSREGAQWIHSLISKYIRTTPRNGNSRYWLMHNRGGFRYRRTRKEYRMLTDRERANFHRAIQLLKKDTTIAPNKYDFLGQLHMAVFEEAHIGPNFLGWHRMYIMAYEEALRTKVRNVVLPYWDSTLDFDMTNTTESIIWSPKFMGSGSGNVRDGPFANWQVLDTGMLTRETGFWGSLFSKENISSVLSRRRTEEITIPNAQTPYDFEGYHGSVHNWVGGSTGHMSWIAYSSFDPVFYLLHTYVDYIWELFRKKQRRLGIDPSTDYPENFGNQLHAPNQTMVWFPWFKNIDGYSDVFTSVMYQYAPAPTCSRRFPTCRSKYLRCDTTRYRCVSITIPKPMFPKLRTFPSILPRLSGPQFSRPQTDSRTRSAKAAARRGNAG